MKRYLAFFICLVSATLFLFAKGRTEEQARLIAQKFMNGKNMVGNRNMSRSRGLTPTQNSFYIFNVEGGGFVIVSGDDRTEDVLGYSYEGKIDMDNIPPNLKFWLEGYDQQIKSLGTTANVVKAPRKARAAIEPLIKTKWHQKEPYNLDCPIIDGKRSVTGCVATAIAQLLYYYKWPKETIPKIDGYNIQNIDGTIKASYEELPSTSFNWDIMREKYVESDTDEGAKEVAKLMRYCGQATEMDYGTEVSGTAYSKRDWRSIFGYNSTEKLVSRINYPISSWEEMIYNDISHMNPVLYGGTDWTEEGHAFIIDGYDGEDKFHFNWGWSVESNAYFIFLDQPYIYFDQAYFGVKPSYNQEGQKFEYSSVEGIKLEFLITSDIDGERYCKLVKCENRDYEGEITIPHSCIYNGKSYSVKSIGEYAFRRCCATSFILPSSLEQIENYAFNKCNNLTSISIPSNVYIISSYAFLGCENLMSIDISGGNRIFDSRDNCNAVIETKSNSLVLGIKTTKISNTIRSISSLAFNEIKGLNLTIPNSVNTMEMYSFRGCKNLSITVLSSNPMSINENAFYELDKNSKLYVPSGSKNKYLQAVGWNAFKEENIIEYVSGANEEYNLSIKSEGNGTVTFGTEKIRSASKSFKVDKGKEVVLDLTPDEGNYLKSITVDGIDVTDKVSNNQYAISNINKDTDVLAIFNAKKKANISFADSEVKRICVEHWDTDGDGEISYDEAKAVTDFGDAFAGSSITTFDEAQYVTGITKFGLGVDLRGCPKLVSIKLPETINEIKNSGFLNCVSLKEITIPNSVISIGNLAFSDCTSLQTIDLKNVTVIGNQAFLRCKSLTTIEISGSVSSIGINSFGGCKNLKDIIVNQQNKAYCSVDGVLYSKDKKILVQYPGSRIGDGIINEGTESICENAFYQAQITSITIPETVKMINKSAFMYCYNLEKVILPSNFAKLEDGTFYGCAKLGSISLPQSLTTIGHACFISCKALSKIEIPENVSYIGSSAFRDSELDAVISYMKTPCEIDETVFQGISSSAILYVPSNSISVYREADNWKDFYQILPNDKSQDEAYVTFDNGTLTFFYDTERTSRSGSTYNLNKGSNKPKWLDISDKVTKAVFDPSFSKARPTSMFHWFGGFVNLKTIEGIEYLNTSSVSNMAELFYDCQSLEKLDLSGFDTRNVTNMELLFGNCYMVKELNINSFETEKVSNMWGMFVSCRSLSALDLSHFDTNNVINMGYLFASCVNLSKLDVSSFSTDNVTQMYNMFYNCSKLQEINLSHFDTKKVKDMYQMFFKCDHLCTIVLGNEFVLKNEEVFYECNQLKDVIIKNPTPSAIESTTFPQSIRTQATLHVPLGHRQNYLAAEYWKEFASIVEIDERTAQTMTLTSLPAMTYGDNNYKLPTTTNEGLQLVWSCDGDAASIVGNYLILKNAGSATVVASQEGNTQYQPFSRTFTLTINKAKLTITAKSYSKKQYEEVPSFEAEYSGFKYNDTENVLTKKPELVCSATATSGPGKYAIYVSGAEARNYDIKYVNGVLTVTEAESTVRKGDVNSDGSVDVADVVATVNYILGRSSAGFVVAAADINGDKAIDVADVVGMVNIILGRNAARSVEKNEAAAMENDVLALDGGLSNRFALSLENQGRYVAAQFDVELSDGLEIESVTLNKERFGEHRVAYAQIGERLYRVMVYSMDGTAIGGERGEILAMQLSGNGAFRIKDIAFVTSVLGVKRFAVLQNGTTGIQNLETGRPVDVYGIDGRLIRRQTTDLKGLKKGVYVVDGQKVVMK